MAKSAWVALAGFIALALLWGGLQLYVWQPKGIARDSFVYTLKVPARAKQFALWKPQAQPIYDVGVGDGDARQFTLIRYPSQLSLAALEGELRDDGYACERVGERVMTCDRSRGGVLDAQVTAEHQPNAERSNITVYLPD